jgi:hypothetical protein
MKKSLIVLLVILVLLVIAFLRFSSPEDTWLCENGEWIKHGNPSQAQPATSCVGLNDKQSDSDKIIVEQYIRDNVKTIVPEKPVLGGSWYITSVNINPSAKTGTMTYEDGHIQGNKSFSYIRNNNEVKINLMDSILSEAEVRVKEPVACTMDAKQCPDGSYVGRSGPNCEFVCPQ